MRYLPLFLSLLIFVACGGDAKDKDKGILLAKVYDQSLYLKDIGSLIDNALSEEDSAAFVKSYVEKWIRETVIVKKAEESLPEERKNVEARLENYRRGLLIYEFEKEYARQKLDTLVKDEEIEQHYNDNLEDFKLPDYVLKVLYVKVEKDNKGRDKINKWYKSTQQKDLLDLEKYCADNAVNYFNDPENWIYLNDLLREVPLKMNDKLESLRSNKYISFEDEEFAYYLTIYDYQVKDATSPLNLEKENIKARILNARTTELIRRMRQDLFTEASTEIKNYVEE